jgi:nucleoside phosphorylase
VGGEWQYPAARDRYNDVLAGVAWEGGCLARLIRPAVIDRLRAGDPAHSAIRDCAVSLVVKTTTLPDDELGQIAAARCRELALDSEAFFMWSGVCLQVNADQAITILEDRLRGHPTADVVVLGICEMLQGEIRPRLPFVGRPDYLKPSALVRLILLVYRHIRPEDDIDRTGGGPFTPTARDNASRFRNSLLTRLAQSDDPGAIASLRTLLARDELATHRDWILHLLDERIVSDADHVACDPVAIRAFAHEPAGPKPRPDMVLVTVNKHETRAVFDAFEAATGGAAVAVSLEERVYHDLGTLNGTRVFHAISEMGSGGIGAMQQTVDKAIRALDPGAVIAVGIAFGVDENKQAIGDILLSKQLRLYELQRIGKDSKIVLRGSRPDASPRLLSHFGGFSQTKWKGAPVKSGVMLTGEKLVDNVDYRSQLLGFESEAIGGEMEGAGLYVSGYDHKVDWIVLKAICDFADGNKGKEKEERQTLAAKNAAQFLIEALQYSPLKRIN